MSAREYPVDGACMCGRVRMRVSAAPIITMACHCTGCQKMSASAFSLTALVPAEAFAVVSGETMIGALHGPSRYVHCAHCLNWLYTAPEGMPFVNVRPGLFAVPAWSTPFAETCTSEKLPWATTSARHSFAAYPPPESYESLMREYAAWSAGQ